VITAEVKIEDVEKRLKLKEKYLLKRAQEIEEKGEKMVKKLLDYKK
jgi:hypothetical protein